MNLFQKVDSNANSLSKVQYTKGMSPDELISVLTDQMLTEGMDALGKFKRLGAGIDYSDEGLAYVLDDKRRFLEARLDEQRREKSESTQGIVFLGGNEKIEAGVGV